MSDFVGAGWAFPPRIETNRGKVALVSGDAAIQRAIRLILGTPIGQRVMRPTFGSRLHELVFATFTSQTAGLIELYVQEALAFWEPRIEVMEVKSDVDQTQPEVLLIEIFYRIKATYDERSLVYPFYRIPGE